MKKPNDTFGVLSVYIQHRNGVAFEQKMSILLHILCKYGGFNCNGAHQRVRNLTQNVENKVIPNLLKSVVSFHSEAIDLAEKTKDNFIQKPTEITTNEDIDMVIGDLLDLLEEPKITQPINIPKHTPKSLHRIDVTPYADNDDFSGYRLHLPLYESTRTGFDEAYYRWFRFLRNRFTLRTVVRDSNATGRLIKQKASEPFDTNVFTPQVLNNASSKAFDHTDKRKDNATYEWLV